MPRVSILGYDSTPGLIFLFTFLHFYFDSKRLFITCRVWGILSPYCQIARNFVNFGVIFGAIMKYYRWIRCHCEFKVIRRIWWRPSSHYVSMACNQPIVFGRKDFLTCCKYNRNEEPNEEEIACPCFFLFALSRICSDLLHPTYATRPLWTFCCHCGHVVIVVNILITTFLWAFTLRTTTVTFINLVILLIWEIKRICGLLWSRLLSSSQETGVLLIILKTHYKNFISFELRI